MQRKYTIFYKKLSQSSRPGMNANFPNPMAVISISISIPFILLCRQWINYRPDGHVAQTTFLDGECIGNLHLEPIRKVVDSN